MKIISLNTWGARVDHNKFLNFFNKNRNLTDVFCLQEVWHFTLDNYKKSTFSTEKVLLAEAISRNAMIDLFSQIGRILFNHKGIFHPHRGLCFGLATFIKNDIKLVEEGEVFVFKDRTFDPKGDVGNHARNIQYITVETKNGLRTIINFYGLWNKEGKSDTKDRLLQSDNIIKFIKNLSNPFIICGDFNLSPDTESLKKFESFGLRNLIKEYGVTSTRTSLYKKEHHFADYVFVSEGITVNEFKILPDEISDHSPIFLDIL